MNAIFGLISVIAIGGLLVLLIWIDSWLCRRRVLKCAEHQISITSGLCVRCGRPPEDL